MKKFLGIFALVLFQITGMAVFADFQYDKINPAISSYFMIESVLRNEMFSSIKNEIIIYSEAQTNINFINPNGQDNSNSYYPGFRGPNQLIVYTPEYGIRTGTNEYGTEAIVENNMVVSMNGADSQIPYNGFVISGHGKAKNWIMKNLQIGSKVYIDYDNKIIKCFLTPDSLMFAAKNKIKEVTSLLDYYRKVDILYNDKKVSEYLEKSKKLLSKAEKNPENTQTYISEAMELLDDALKNVIPYHKSEMKGLWVRPVENTPEKIAQAVEKMYNAGITDIFLETFFHGKTIYESEYLKKRGVIAQREEFAGFDPLEVWINEAHKRKMKVHIWFECFYLGNDNPQILPNHILKIYPDWSNKRFTNYSSQTPVSSISEHNGYFLDPANADVQTFLCGILEEIITNYKIDGINLDYIRYPQSADTSYSGYALTNWGYTQTAREQFKMIYGIDPVEVEYGTISWEFWSVFRQNKISEFVKTVKDMSKSKDILVTAVIFPDLRKSIETKMQNWKLWSKKNYIDGFTPLLLTGDKNTADSLLQEVTNNIDNSTQIYPGIFVTFMGGSFEDLLFQLHKTREFKSKGNVIFDYAHFGDKYIEALTTRIYNAQYDEKKFHAPAKKKDFKPEVKFKDRKSRRTS